MYILPINLICTEHLLPLILQSVEIKLWELASKIKVTNTTYFPQVRGKVVADIIPLSYILIIRLNHFYVHSLETNLQCKIPSTHLHNEPRYELQHTCKMWATISYSLTKKENFILNSAHYMQTQWWLNQISNQKLLNN